MFPCLLIPQAKVSLPPSVLSGVEFRWCARPDCNQMFRKETGHDKIYCSPECAHLTAVRASRARLNKATTRKKRSCNRL